MRLPLWVCAVTCLALAGCKGDPTTPEYWAKALAGADGKREKERVASELRESPHVNASFLPMMHRALAEEKNPKARTEIARKLGDLKSPTSVTPLAEAVDLSASDSAANELNRTLVIALGAIGDKAAIPHLLKWLNARDPYTRIEAISALGTLKATEAVDSLLAILADGSEEPFVAKKAIQALGSTRDPRSIPVLTKMMFYERKGVSFYPESSFALFQIGAPAIPAVRAVFKGEDKPLAAWAKENKIIEPAMFAKSAQVLGDLQDVESASALLSRLKFESEFLDVKLFVRMRVADALGRLRAQEAATPLAAMLSEEEPTAKQEYVRALTLIGGRGAIAALTQSAAKGDFTAREMAAHALALLGDERELPVLEKWAKDEPGLTAGECKRDADVKGCSNPETLGQERAQGLAREAKALEAAQACKADGACWAKKLESAEPVVRERAALEVGRSRQGPLLAALIGRARDADVDARLAAVQAAFWLMRDVPESAAKVKDKAAVLEKQLDEERQSTEFVKVNEDLRRLSFRLSSL
ncbi:MAG TPA: HEAT repeat domain-containing protein [Myxococcaceae bacterium]|nr:HEAT repeat domain-containing protein [Myxococcaceae bacterium]